MFKNVNPKQNFPELESEVLDFWKKKKIFEKSVELRPESDKFVFYDGPPFITGTPHYGTLLSRIAKDVVPRFWTMMGKRVERQWGWDCHGLPIENKVEKKLGLNNRREIEKIGVQKFIDECYTYTKETSADWEWYKDKVGQWVDFENAYKTMDLDYMESVMWVFKKLHDEGRIYEGTRVSLYCTRCGTPISNFEIAMDNSYAVMNDPAVTPKFKLKGEDNTYVLAWTTTPWTLPANKALVVDKEATYVKVKRKVEIKRKKGIYGILVNEAGLIGLLVSKRNMEYWFAGGSIEEGESDEKTLEREIKEETGYQNFEISRKLGTFTHQISNSPEKIIEIDKQIYLVKLTDKQRLSPQLSDDEKNFIKQEFLWMKPEEARNKLKPQGLDKLVDAVIEEKAEMEIAPFIISTEEKEEFIILAKDRLKETFATYQGEAPFEIVAEFKGEKLVGKTYEPLFNLVKSNDKDFQIYHFEGMVTMDDGVGIVHSAPGFGDIDTEMGEHFGLSMAFNVDDEGKYTEEMGEYAGMYIKKADPFIIADLQKRNLIFRSERIDHRYPFCYRCETPLIHRAQNSWYLRVQDMKERMLKNNEHINWVPDHMGTGRFAKGLESAPDWGISRTRYWATPMPVWRDESTKHDPETIVVGSRDELKDLADQPITKLVFVNANFAESMNSEMEEKGWEAARHLEEKYKGKVDLLIAADFKKAEEVLAPLVNDSSSKEIEKNPNFGSIEMLQNFEKSEKRLLEKFEVETLSDIDEDELINEFGDDITFLKNEVDQLINAHEGKTIVIATLPHVIALMLHRIADKKLRVAFRTSPSIGKEAILFMDGTSELNLHKPYIDKFTITSPKTGKKLTRIFDVCDVWLESGSMPYAMKHYPFEQKKDFEKNFPADFVVEYVAQTRAWFYVMHVLSTALQDTNPFKNVVTTGVMAGTDGRKMSKSYGNYPDPKETILKYGADPLRLYFMGSKIMVAEDVAFNEGQLADQIKTIILPLWNSYSFLVTYANLKGYSPSPDLMQVNTGEANWNDVPFKPSDKLNIWILSKLQLMILNVRESMIEYNIPKAMKEFPEFLGDLSKWYIRRSRSKFNDNEKEFFDTLYYVLVEFIKLLAPFAPFSTEAIYENLVKNVLEDQPESLHLTDYPEYDSRFIEDNEKVLAQMEMVREIVNLGQSLRVQNNLKVRQPLAEMEIKFVMDPDRNLQLENWMKELISDELNIKKIDEDFKINDYKGWIVGEGEKYGLKVSINTNLSAELIREGIARDLSRGIQAQRKKHKLNIDDYADVVITTDSKEIIENFNMFEETLKTSVRAKSIKLNSQKAENGNLNYNGSQVQIEIQKI